MLADTIDPLRGLLLNHPLLQPLKYDDTGEPPLDAWIPGTLYVYESDASDEHDLAGVGPQDRERFDIHAVIVAPKRGEGITRRTGRATSLWLDSRREAILEVVRRNRSRFGTFPGPPVGTYTVQMGVTAELIGQPFTVGNSTPWLHLEGRGDIRFERVFDTRLAAVRINGWRILPNEEI